jgi:hypothetical protein
MKRFRIMGFLMCFAVLSACATIYDVKYDYDQQIDFQRLKTYDWMPVPDGAVKNELVMELVKNATDAELAAKGLEKEPAAPDFLVVGHVSAKEVIEVDNWGYGYGPYDMYRGGYWGPGGVATYRFEEGSLVLDFVDTNTKRLIWRGSAKAEIDAVDSAEKSWEIIKKAVKEILKKYPPPSK